MAFEGETRQEFEVYRNRERCNERQAYFEELRLPIRQQIEINDYDMNSPIPTVSVSTLTLRKHRASIHLSYELLEDLFHMRIDQMNRGNNYRGALERLTGMLSLVSRETESRLRVMQPVDEGHPVILDRVRIVNQLDSRLILIDMIFWAVRSTDADLGRLMFERTLHELLSGNINDISSNGTFQIERPYVEPKKYKVDAEEHAHELLKSMLTKKQFEMYKDAGFVIIKGTRGRVYKVRKKDMISVVQKRKGLKEKNYRLCLEPREHGAICPTDEVIAKIKLIQADEKKLHELGNRFDGYFGINALAVNPDGSISVDGNGGIGEQVLNFNGNGIAEYLTVDSNGNITGNLEREENE